MELEKISAENLKQELEAANRALISMREEGKALQESLKLAWNSADFQRAQSLAQQAMRETAQRAVELQSLLDALEGQEEQERSPLYEELTRALQSVQEQAKAAGEQLEQLNRLGLGQLQATMEQASSKLDGFGGALTKSLTNPLK